MLLGSKKDEVPRSQVCGQRLDNAQDVTGSCQSCPAPRGLDYHELTGSDDVLRCLSTPLWTSTGARLPSEYLT
jgi:hypothetical protein